MVRKVNAEEFLKDAKAADAAVVDFNATWCGPCRMLAPVLEELSEEFEGKVNFYNVDVDDDTPLAAAFGISSVPTVLLLKNGKVADQSIGFRPGSAMKAWIEGNL